MFLLKNVLKPLLLVTFLMLASCAVIDEKVSNPNKSKLGVLVMAGAGLNPTYPDARDGKVSSFWFVTSQKIAESLHAEVQKKGTEAQLFINTDQNVQPTTSLVQLLADKKRDGLIQVAIRHIKDDTENSVYLEFIHNTLTYQKSDKGENVVIGQGLTEKHKLVGDPTLENWMMRVPLAQYASEFTEKLYKAGYIGAE